MRPTGLSSVLYCLKSNASSQKPHLEFHRTSHPASHATDPASPFAAMTTEDGDFVEAAERGDILIDSHEATARVAYVYWFHGHDRTDLCAAVDKLHEQGWSFGRESLRFNQ